MKTHAEAKALAERIVLATTDRTVINFEGSDAWKARHPEAARDREWIAGRFRDLHHTMYWPEAEQRAKVDWLAMVLAEACGVEV